MKKTTASIVSIVSFLTLLGGCTTKPEITNPTETPSSQTGIQSIQTLYNDTGHNISFNLPENYTVESADFLTGSTGRVDTLTIWDKKCLADEACKSTGDAVSSVTLRNQGTAMMTGNTPQDYFKKSKNVNNYDIVVEGEKVISQGIYDSIQ